MSCLRPLVRAPLLTRQTWWQPQRAKLVKRCTKRRALANAMLESDVSLCAPPMPGAIVTSSQACSRRAHLPRVIRVWVCPCDCRGAARPVLRGVQWLANRVGALHASFHFPLHALRWPCPGVGRMSTFRVSSASGLQEHVSLFGIGVVTPAATQFACVANENG